MNKNIQKAIDILEKKEYKRIAIEVTPSNIEELKNVIKSYIASGFGEFSRNWQQNLEDKEIMTNLNYLFFSLSREKEYKIVMRRQRQKYHHTDGDYFFPNGTFFNVERGLKKKLEL